MSDNGARVAFIAVINSGTGTSTNAVMVYNRLTGVTERVDDGPSRVGYEVRISANGRYVAYDGSCTTCPILSGSRVVVRDLSWKRTFEPVVGFDGAVPNFSARIIELSADGRYLLLDSSRTNLVEGARGGNVFVFDRLTGATSHVSRGADGTQPNGVSFNASMNNGGARVAFHSQADSISPYPIDGLGNHLYVASLDLDNDGLHDHWERFFNDSPMLPGPDVDEDGDGLSNLEEFERGTHPRGRFGWSLQAPPESDAWGIKLHNLTRRPARVVFRLMDNAGNTSTQAMQLPALSSTPIRLTAFPDRAQTEFTLEVESDESLFGLRRR